MSVFDPDILSTLERIEQLLVQILQQLKKED